MKVVNGKFKYADAMQKKKFALTLIVKYWEQLLSVIISRNFLLTLHSLPSRLFNSLYSNRVLLLLLCRTAVPSSSPCINIPTNRPPPPCPMLLTIYLSIPFNLFAHPGLLPHLSIPTRLISI